MLTGDHRRTLNLIKIDAKHAQDNLNNAKWGPTNAFAVKRAKIHLRVRIRLVREETRPHLHVEESLRTARRRCR